MSERTIIAVVSEFRGTGLTVEQQILMDELVILTATLQARADAERERREANTERMRSVRARAELCSTQGQSPHTPRDITKIKNPPKPPKTNSAFENFYSAYPKKVGRGSAAKAHRNALNRGSEADILAGAQRYAKERAGQDAQYTARPTTWLNDDRWLDEPEKKVRTFTATPAPRPWKEQQAERESKP